MIIKDIEIKYSEEDTLDVATKPTLHNAHSFDFNLLTNRNFEVLLYRIFKDQIQRTNELAGQFDCVNLMLGVRERGRDCALFYDSKHVGLIQCKKYEGNVGLTLAAEEIIKFLLYSIVDESIFDVNNDGHFIYYLAVSSGVANGVSDYLPAFGTNASADDRLKTWVESTIRKNVSLSHLKYVDIEDILKDRLSHIKVEIILPEDIMGWLRGQQLRILPDFFEVQKVVDIEALEPIYDILNTLSSERDISIEHIMSNMKDASAQLRNIPCDFYVGEGIHIDRPEVSSIFDWINSDDKNNHNIALVVGGAGCGKSVIMRDVLMKCDAQDIIVLGLKADMQKSTTLGGLTDVANLSVPIVDAIRQIALVNKKVVVLIDQIDALSQYLSASREFIATYNQLIDNLKASSNIKIIISSRLFDLENDPSIQMLKKDSTQFKINILSKEQVDSVLQNIGIDPKSINSDLYRLLRTPVNLDLFCRMYKFGSYDMSQIRNIYQLYEAFWVEKIIAQYPNDKGSLKNFLFNISQDIYNLQDLHISIKKYQDDYLDEIAFLKSQGVILESEGRVSFFHQSFYDFVFAKYFVSSDRDLLGHINSEGQSINIRASFKIILTFLRDYNLRTYVETLRQIITDESSRFHIQYLTYTIIGSEIAPNRLEIELIEDEVLDSQDRLTLFLPLCCSSDKWFEWIMSNDVVSVLDPSHDRYETTINSIVYSNINKHTNKIIQCIKEHRNLEIFSNDRITEYLCGIRVWNDDSILFVKEIVPAFDILNHYHRHILSQILTTHQEFVFKTIDFTNIINSENPKVFLEKYDINKFIELLIAAAPYQSSIFLFDFLNELIARNQNENGIRSIYGNLVDDDIFNHYLFYEDDKRTNIIGQFISLMKESAAKGTMVYDVFWNRAKDSKYAIWNYVLAISLESAPQQHQDKIAYLLQKALRYGEYGNHVALHHELWLLIQVCFPIVNRNTQILIVDVINKIQPQKEAISYKYRMPNNTPYTHIGRIKYCYLRALPSAYIESNSTLKRSYGELRRKYGDDDEVLFNWEKGIVAASYVSPPLSNKAYENMNFKQWLNSFYKIGDNRQYHRNIFGGGIDEHSSAFKRAVCNRPEHFFNFVAEIQQDSDVLITYKRSGVEGLVEAEYAPYKVVPLFLALERESETDDFSTILMARKLYENTPDSIDMFEFICNSTLKYRSRDEGEFTLSHAINTVQGGGVTSIIMSYENKELHDRIFDVLFHLATNGLDSSKLAILCEIAFLNYIDKDRAFDLLMICMCNVCDESIKAAGHMLKYYHDYYDKMQQIFACAINTINEKDNKRTILMYLAYYWLENKENADILFKRAIDRWGTDCAEYVVDIALSYISNESYTDKCFEMLYSCIDSNDEKVTEAYSFGFLRHESVDLMLIHPFVVRLIESACFNSYDSYFYEYLFKQSKKHPELVLDIVALIDFSKSTNGKGEIYSIDDTRIKVVLGALNSIVSSRKKRMYTSTATDIIDNIIKHSRRYFATLQQLDKDLA